jgi:large subunit ribosomal protein L24
VIIVAGKDKGTVGEVLKVLGEKIIVANANIAKKHVRPNPNLDITGGIIDKAMPIHISNVAIYNEATGKADKIGFRLLEDGSKVRFYKSTGEVV